MNTLAMLFVAAAAAGSDQQAEEALARAVEEAVSATYQAGALAGNALSFYRPAQRRVELGAVVDARASDGGGLPVLAITPNGFAERVGMRKGDRLMAINTNAVRDAASLRAAIQQATGSDQIAVDIVRDGTSRQLVGAADVRELPAFTLSIAAQSEAVETAGCGFVSGGARRNDDVVRVAIEQVNGQPADQDLMGRVQLPAGSHRLVVRPMARALPPSPASFPTEFPYDAPSSDWRLAPNTQRTLPGTRFVGDEIVVNLVVRADRVHRLGASALSDGSWLIVEDKVSTRKCSPTPND